MRKIEKIKEMLESKKQKELVDLFKRFEEKVEKVFIDTTPNYQEYQQKVRNILKKVHNAFDDFEFGRKELENELEKTDLPISINLYTPWFLLRTGDKNEKMFREYQITSFTRKKSEVNYHDVNSKWLSEKITNPEFHGYHNHFLHFEVAKSLENVNHQYLSLTQNPVKRGSSYQGCCVRCYLTEQKNLLLALIEDFNFDQNKIDEKYQDAFEEICKDIA
jgi:hypothetical protein